MALFRLQSIPGLLEIGGVRPLPVAALAILVATMEREPARRIVLHLLRVSV